MTSCVCSLCSSNGKLGTLSLHPALHKSNKERYLIKSINKDTLIVVG